MSTSRPDVVVGIDVGQTCTGVAYSIGPDWSDPRVINRWPSVHGQKHADKVATRIGYTKFEGSIANWGFQCDFGDENTEIREEFKLALDSDYEDDRGFGCDDARLWYTQYLQFLYREIDRYFDSSIPNWREKRVEYIFSTPTTWINPAMIASIEELIKSAGFAESPNQTVRMGLTEAEAAAIEAATTSYRQGDIFMICDAGGGTTDVNIMRVKSVEPKIELDPLDHVEGVPIGSTLIDRRMGQHISERLSKIERHLEANVDTLTEEMLQGNFQTAKHSFPSPPVDRIWLDVKGLAGRQSFPDVGIENSKMVIERSTLKRIFDEQVSRMFELIDERLQAVEAEYPGAQLSYIILSGGLGSSPYLYNELKNRYEKNVNYSAQITRPTRIKKVLEPQLAVVRGLVRERTQQLGNISTAGQEVFTSRRCRNSYGVAIRQRYDETVHFNLPTTTGHDGVLWVEHCVDWFIRKGEQISVKDGVKRKYVASIRKEDANMPRQARIVMSTAPATQLPYRMSNDGHCHDVATVKYQLTESDMKLKNRQFWRFYKKQYWKAEFDLVIKLGPADLQFQIVGDNGVLSASHDSVEVQYMDPSDGRSHRQTESPHEAVGPMLEAPSNSRSPERMPSRRDSVRPTPPTRKDGGGWRSSIIHRHDRYA